MQSNFHFSATIVCGRNTGTRVETHGDRSHSPQPSPSMSLLCLEINQNIPLWDAVYLNSRKQGHFDKVPEEQMKPFQT